MTQSRRWLALATACTLVAVLAAKFAWFPAEAGMADSLAPGSMTSGEESIWRPQPLLIVKDGVLPPASVHRAVAQYRSVNPRSFPDLMHRWRVDLLDGAWDTNPGLRHEVSSVLSWDGYAARFPDAGALFFPSKYGWEVRRRAESPDGHAYPTEAHVDQFLATCAEVGVPLSQNAQTPAGNTSIRALLDTSCRRFVIDQDLNWTLLAYAQYQPGRTAWVNHFGESHSFATVADRILQDDVGTGPCFGTHPLYLLAVLLQLDDEQGIFPPDVRGRVEARLQDAAQRLAGRQYRNGAWDVDWAAPPGKAVVVPRGVDAPFRRFLTTAHHLEWVSVAPPRCRPEDRYVAGALTFLLHTILEHRPEELAATHYCSFSHAIRALLVARPAS